jgi:maleate isomerase
MAQVHTAVERDDLKLMEKPRRLGLILPSSNTAMEEELPRILPAEEVVVHSSRARLTDVTPEALVEMETTSEISAVQLADAGVDIIEYTCSAKLGYDHDLAFAAELQKLTGVRSVPYTQGVVEGLQSLGAKRIAVATPYIQAVDVLETEFYEGAGFEIVNIEGLGIIDNVKSGLVSPAFWYDFVKEVDRPEADAVFISCTQVRAIEVVDRLEKELGKPVVAANVAALWIMLKETGYSKPIRGYGKLLELL